MVFNISRDFSVSEKENSIKMGNKYDQLSH